MENNNYSVGIDLGIGSVGWSIVDIDNNVIIDKGVYLFNQAEAAAERRGFRSARRRKKRKLHRIERIYLILDKYGISNKNTIDEYLIEKRITGISEKIEMQDIVNIICYFARHRGYIPYDDNDDRKSEIADKLRDKGLLACQMQKEIINNYGKYRGAEYLILHSDYEKELRVILNNQKQYHEEIDDNFIDEIIEVINSKRKFWEGPGGPRENQLNKYGRYKTIEDLNQYRQNKNYNKYLFESLIGDCSVYKGEKKASMWNYYAECFNFYNDIVNLRINVQDLDETNRKYFVPVTKELYKLSRESISKLKDIVLSEKSVSYKKIFKKEFNVDFDNVFGYKKDKDGNEDLARFRMFKWIKNKLEDESLINELLNDMDSYNKAVYLIQVSPSVDTRLEILKDNLSNNYSEELLEKLANLSLDNKYHSFSEKALKKYLELMEEYNENSSYIERNFQDEIQSDTEAYIIKEYIKNVKEGELKYINSKGIDDIIASPATKKALRKGISVLNKIFSKYGYPKYICIENTTALLSKDKQKEYENKTLDNQIKRKNASKKLSEAGYDASDVNIDKWLLLQETNNRCIYCGKELTVANCEIEHILPISITANDTFLNKTCSCTQCNTAKGNKTPYQYLMTIGTYQDFKERVLNSKSIPQEKKQNLLFEQDINKYEKNFKNRNLNDTAYATNELANQLKIFKKAYLYNNQGEFLDFNILKVPGQFTGIIRDRANIPKNRDLHYHHAVDATIIACTPKLKVGRLINIIQNEPDKYWKLDSLNDYRESLYDELYLKREIKEELLRADFSNTRMVQEANKNTNGSLFDANIQKVVIKDGQYYKINQINNIYELAPSEKFLDDFTNGRHYLCQDNNIELYNRLLKICKMYKGKKVNPFVEYCKENNLEDDETFDYNKHGIRQGLNAKSSVVVRLRYLSKVNNPYIVDTRKLPKSSKEHKKDIMLMYDSVSSYCTRVYRDKESGELYFMPIYKIFINSKTGEIKEDTDYYRKIYDKYVGKDISLIEKYMDIYNNEYVRFKTKDGEYFEGLVSGFDKTLNKIEIKKCKKSITKNTAEIEKIKSDVLGLYNLNF